MNSAGKKFIATVLCLFLLAVAANAQTGINTTSPNTNAVLDIVSNSKGILIPRLNLTATTNASPISSHVQGMIVYNLATVNDVVPGLYLNSGTEWLKLTTNVPRIVAHARNTVTQTVLPSTPRTKVEFNTLNRTDGNFDLSTETYTVPKAGYYRVEVILGVTPSTTSNSQIVQLEMATNEFTLWTFNNQPASLITRPGSVTRSMNAGDKIIFYFQPCNGCPSPAASYVLSRADIIISRISE